MGILELLIIILLILWLAGMGTGYVLGGFLHILIILAIVLAIVRLAQGRPTL